jgi:hypothetical protein
LTTTKRFRAELAALKVEASRKQRKHIKAVAAAFLAQSAIDGAVHDLATMHPDDRAYWLDTVNYIITKHEELSR